MYSTKLQTGFSLLETVLTVSILATGLLSVMSVQIYALKQLANNKNHIQAIALLSEMSNKLRANPDAVKHGFYQSSLNHDCRVEQINCNAAEFAQHEYMQWLTQIQSGSIQQQALGSLACHLKNSDSDDCQLNFDCQCRINISWLEQDQLLDEPRSRNVSMVVNL
jgi:Tfp pilus assembly protein PilV